MKNYQWYKNDKIPADGSEVVILTFYSDHKLIGHYDKQSNSVVGDNHLWRWEDVEFWFKLPEIKKEDTITP